ncbi:MAG: VWA domain-containing protein [Meiothermus sp.]
MKRNAQNLYRLPFTVGAVLWVVLLGGLWLASGCRARPQAVTLTVLAGSELKDLEPLLPDLRDKTGVELKMSYTGTLEGVDRLLNGEKFDLAWFSHAKYLLLRDPKLAVAQERIMLSPVVMGVKTSKAKAWGWDKSVTWKAIAEKSAAGQLRFAMTNPATSNSGFTGLLGVWAALSGKSDAAQGNEVGPQALKGFFRGQAATAGSSGWLADSYVQQQDRLDGLINYESVLLSLNQGGKLREPLTLLYPAEGVVTADYPLILLNAAQREAFSKAVAYLKQPDLQKKIMEMTLRRPVTASVTLSSAFPNALLVELPFPASALAVDGILSQYFAEQRRPAHSFFVLDVSGSMAGQRLQGLQQAILNLAGADTSTTGQYARFQPREEVTVITFSNRINPPKEFRIGRGQNDPQLSQMRGYVKSLRADGGTAIYSALQQAYTLLQQAQSQEPERIYSVVLMTDGENNQGIDLNSFVSFYNGLSGGARAAHIFPILFGEGNKAEMERLAQATGGRVFDGRNSLAAAFKEIRGYQ